jgi:phosphotransferase system  glucose/maltose/N-acetylglucosamine-specific IIC component
MGKAKNILIVIVVVLSIACILLAILSSVSADTLVVFLGVALLVLSAAMLQK